MAAESATLRRERTRRRVWCVVHRPISCFHIREVGDAGSSPFAEIPLKNAERETGKGVLWLPRYTDPPSP